MTVAKPVFLPAGGRKYFCFATSIADGVACLAISGRLVLGAEAADSSLCDTIARVVPADTREIIIDLGGLEQMDAAGIGELALSCTTARSEGMAFVLENPRPRIKKLLEICRLDTCLMRKPAEVANAYVAAAE